MAGEDRYRLAPVRDARERDERIRRGDLAVAVGDARETALRLETVRARTAVARTVLTTAIAARDTLMRGAMTPDQLVRADRYIAKCRGEVERAIGEELRTESVHGSRLGSLDEARQRLARARADREVIERHFANWRQARRQLADRRED
ncbi:MAG TPA: hypothetical protein VIV11_14550 [Kofleriaceae bacterium]